MRDCKPNLSVKQKEFDTWIEGSKVTDPSGIPLRVYTGSSHDIKDFRTDVGTGKSHGTGVFFNSSPAVASTYTGGINGGNITPAYLSLKSPVQLDAKGANWNQLTKSTKISLPALEVNDKADQDLLAELLGEPISKVTTTIRKARNTTLGKLFPDEFLFDDFFTTDDIARWARKEGYEGVIFENVIDRGPTGILVTEEAEKPHTVYVCFEADQIRNSITYGDCQQKIMSEKQSANHMVFHGTPNGVFDRFDTTPIYFTDSREVAEGYATGCYARYDSDLCFPVLISAQLDLKNPKTYTEAELIALTSDENEIDWSNLDSVIYDLQDQGYDSMIIIDAYDYVSGSEEDVKRGRYNQYVAFDAKQVKIIEQVDILGLSPQKKRKQSKHDHSSSLEMK